MQYVALIYSEEGGPPPTPEQMEKWFEFGDRHEEAILGGNALQASTTATSVRVRDGEVLLTDGPFAETREALGGFYLFEAEDLDAAIAFARDMPAADYGTIEVRPVMVLDRR